MLEHTAIGILFGLMAIVLVDRYIQQQPQPVLVELLASNAQILTDTQRVLERLSVKTNDIWRVGIYTERETGRMIRRAYRLGFEVSKYRRDSQGNIHVLFERVYTPQEAFGDAF